METYNRRVKTSIKNFSPLVKKMKKIQITSGGIFLTHTVDHRPQLARHWNKCVKQLSFRVV